MAFGGDGIAREEGKVIFIEGAVPGEIVEAEILQDKKRFAKARTVQKIESAADEIPAFCPVFSRCGGCDWQHVPYSKQLEWKRQFITSALQKTAHYFYPSPLPMHGSQKLEGFRNRIKLKARLFQGRFDFGYFAKGSHDLVRVAACPIAESSIQAMMKDLLARDWPKDLRWQGELEIQAISDGRRLLHFMPDFPDQKLLASQFPNDAFDPEGSVPFEKHEGTEYRTRAGQFQQVNVEGNHELRAWVKQKLKELKPKTLVDLFCGSGNLSLGLATLDPDLKVWGIEYSEAAIRTAEDNVRENGVKGFLYKAGPANRIREIFPDLPQAIDCVITDPPRQGMDDSIEDLLALKPKHILSVSCDPNTFARDLKRFLECGYVPREIRGMDFFPHSYHIETLAHLEWDPKAVNEIQG